MRDRGARPGEARDGLLDLLLGASCVGCGAPGRMLCASCRAGLPRTAGPCWPDPTPPDLAVPFAAASYDGVVQALVLGHKEHGLSGLRADLSALLAVAVSAALAHHGAPGPVVLVPVPSRRASVRSRGRDVTKEMVRGAVEALHVAADGQPGSPGSAGARTVVLAPLLRTRPGVVDQAGLGVAERRANLDGSMACSSGELRRLARRVGAAHVVVCDDVVTTGATLAEAQRALAAAGVPVLAHACVAATLRRPRPGTGPVRVG